MNLPKERYDQIESAVTNMFINHDIRNIPIDCFEIASKMNVILKPFSRLSERGLAEAMKISEDGFYILVDNEGVEPFKYSQWYIFYNDSMPKMRIRFTIMHELGHIVLDHTEMSDLAEIEANFFASYALAPPPLVHEIHVEDYLDIARAFNVSRQCAYYSFKNYKNWLNFGGEFYKETELELLRQFEMITYLH